MIHSGRSPKILPERAQTREPCRQARLVLLLGSLIVAVFVVTSAGRQKIPDNAHFAGAYPVLASVSEGENAESGTVMPHDLRDASGREMGIWDYIESLFASFLLGE